jgi:hypothetical protein
VFAVGATAAGIGSAAGEALVDSTCATKGAGTAGWFVLRLRDLDRGLLVAGAVSAAGATGLAGTALAATGTMASRTGAKSMGSSAGLRLYASGESKDARFDGAGGSGMAGVWVQRRIRKQKAAGVTGRLRGLLWVLERWERMGFLVS